MTIQIENICLNLGGKDILKDFSLTLPDKGIVCITGPSGCGKTSLLHVLAGLHKPQAGRVTGLENIRLAVVFQEDRLLPWLSGVQNVAVVLPKEDVKQALPYVAAMELENEAHKLPLELSGGMRRRISIARALAYKGDALLLDEPTNGLDYELAVRVMEQIRQHYADKLILLVTHDKEFAQKFADVLIALPNP